MTKYEIIEAIAQKAGITKRAATMAVETLVDSIGKSLKKGVKVTITGFGTFSVSKRSARSGVNPRNPTQKIQIPAMRTPHFKAGKTLKEMVR